LVISIEGKGLIARDKCLNNRIKFTSTSTSNTLVCQIARHPDGSRTNKLNIIRIENA
jgi:hypothetical protein